MQFRSPLPGLPDSSQIPDLFTWRHLTPAQSPLPDSWSYWNSPLSPTHPSFPAFCYPVRTPPLAPPASWPFANSSKHDPDLGPGWLCGSSCALLACLSPHFQKELIRHRRNSAQIPKIGAKRPLNFKKIYVTCFILSETEQCPCRETTAWKSTTLEKLSEAGGIQGSWGGVERIQGILEGNSPSGSSRQAELHEGLRKVKKRRSSGSHVIVQLSLPRMLLGPGWGHQAHSETGRDLQVCCWCPGCCAPVQTTVQREKYGKGWKISSLRTQNCAYRPEGASASGNQSHVQIPMMHSKPTEIQKAGEFKPAGG